MRIILLTLLLATPTWADEVFHRAPATDVTIFGAGAIVTRQASVDLPAGDHTLLIPGDLGAMTPTITGATLREISARTNGLTDPRRAYTPRQTAAHDALEQARAATRDAQARHAQATATIEGAQAQVAFLRSISGGALTTLDPATLSATADTLSTSITAALNAVQTAQTAAITTAQAVKDAEAAQAQAQADFDSLAPPTGPLDLIAFAVTVPASGPVTLHLTQEGYAQWEPLYHIDLIEGDAPSLSIRREMLIRSGQTWEDVTLTLSTADISSTSPAPVSPNRARLDQPQPMLRSSAPMTADAIMMEPAVIVEDTTGGISYDGPAVTYTFPAPVTVRPAQQVLLPFDSFTLPAEVFNAASPRRDETAFLSARITNGPDPLHNGQARFYRNGTLVGGKHIDDIPARADATLSFGPLEHLRLTHKRLDNNTGDRGVFTTSSTRVQDIEITVQNLGVDSETVEALYALPFSEEEDLRVSVTTEPAPDQTDVDQDRGVGLWLLEVAPGQTQKIRLRVQMSWPEGQALRWSP